MSPVEKINRFALIWSMAAIFFCVITSPECMARDFGSAANSYIGTIKTIAQILAPAGIICGGVIMQIAGAEDFGKRVLSGGLVGVLCVFGGPAFVNLVKSVFGGF